MFNWFKDKKVAEEKPKTGPSSYAEAKVTLTHSDGSPIEIHIKGRNLSHVSYVRDRIEGIFKPTPEYNKVYEDFSNKLQGASDELFKEFDKLFEQFNKGK